MRKKGNIFLPLFSKAGEIVKKGSYYCSLVLSIFVIRDRVSVLLDSVALDFDTERLGFYGTPTDA
jgi:hypothetical protein